MSLSNPKRTSFNLSGYRAIINYSAGIYPYFITMVRSRMRDKLSNNILITGEAGSTKTWTGAFQCKLLNRRWNVNEDLVMNYEEYMTAILRKGKTYVPILFDEPQDALYNRDWQRDVNKALVKTWASQRFRLRPVIVAIINQSLIDVNIRKYLLNFHVIMIRKGEGYVYKLSASQTEDKLYREGICQIQYGIMDINKCTKDSCLRCNQLHKKDPSGSYSCTVWRAIYERKKEEEINKRDLKSIDEQKIKLAKKFSNREIVIGIKPDIEKMLIERGEQKVIDPTLVAAQTEEVLGLQVGEHRSYRIRNLLEIEYPQYTRATIIRRQK